MVEGKRVRVTACFSLWLMGLERNPWSSEISSAALVAQHRKPEPTLRGNHIIKDLKFHPALTQAFSLASGYRDR